MLHPDKLQQSLNGYSVQSGGETVWAPYALNGAQCRPKGDILAVPEGGRPSQERFQQLAVLAINSLNTKGIDPAPHAIRHALVDGSLLESVSGENNYRGGVDCSGFVYFVLKDYGLTIDESIAVPPHEVTQALGRKNWNQPEPDELQDILDMAHDKALSLAEFTNIFHDTFQPHRNINVTKFDYSSSPVDLDDAQPGDIVIYRQSQGASSDHVALVKDVRQNGDIKIVHSGRKSWDTELGGVACFTIRRQNISDFFDNNLRSVELKRIDGLKVDSSSNAE